MGVMMFQLPPHLPKEGPGELSRACVVGGPDNMPYPTQVRLQENCLVVGRNVDESGALQVPWEVDGAGRLMSSTATLIERPFPYHLQVELARGKLNQLRNQLNDWIAGGLNAPASLGEKVRDAGKAFCRAMTELPSPGAGTEAQTALHRAYQAAEELVHVYINQVFSVRHQRQPRLDTALGCRLGAVPVGPGTAEALRGACNSVCLPFSWSEVEPSADDHVWAPQDALLDWAQAEGFTVFAGPLIDFSRARLPDWLWLYDRDLHSLAGFMCGYVEAVVRRYRGRIRTWKLTAATNSADILGLGEDELLWLTVRLVEAARQADPGVEVVVGIAQPWGEYLAVADRAHSPFVFADTLIRSGLNLSALNLELVMGVTPRGSYCRDLLETSRLLDLYALLGVPLHLTMGYPAADIFDPQADADLQVTAGAWREGFSPESQADWATEFGALALCKPAVHGVFWPHFADAEPHSFPNAGLLDVQGQPRPVLERLRQLRERHLR